MSLKSCRTAQFHHTEFDTRALAALKGSQRISVCIPTLNEAATIGKIVADICSALRDDFGLVDEVLVIDSGSADATREIAAAAGATVFLASDIAPQAGMHRGKGENLWKSLHVASGDILCFIDGDLENFHPGFVTGLIGPLLTRPEFDYVKAYYERPLAPQTTGGGRVSEILVRPFISLFFPEISSILQPLSGEYAARRSTLEYLPFPTGYGVEIAHLIDIAAAGNAHRIAQTDLVKRVHRNRSDDELGSMAFAILQVIFRRLQHSGKLTLHAPLPEHFHTWAISATGAEPISKHLPEPERPPFALWQKTKIPTLDLSSNP